MTALLDTKDAGTSSNKARDNEPESLRAVNVVAAQPFAFVSLMLENSIISNTWSNITWHRGLTCISQLVYQKCLVYENDLYFHKSIDIEWGLDGPGVAETLYHKYFCLAFGCICPSAFDEANLPVFQLRCGAFWWPWRFQPLGCFYGLWFPAVESVGFSRKPEANLKAQEVPCHVCCVEDFCHCHHCDCIGVLRSQGYHTPCLDFHDKKVKTEEMERKLERLSKFEGVEIVRMFSCLHWRIVRTCWNLGLLYIYIYIYMCVCVCVSLVLSEYWYPQKTILWNKVCWSCDKAVDTYDTCRTSD